MILEAGQEVAHLGHMAAIIMCHADIQSQPAYGSRLLLLSKTGV
jgi:hypothetical protein